MQLPGDVFLAAEAAAHHRAAHAHILVFQAQALGHLAAVAVGNLAAHVDGQLGVVVVVAGGHGHGALRLHKGVLGHGRAIGALDDHIGVGKALVDVAVAHLDVLEQIARGSIRVQHRRVRAAGADRVGHRRQLFVFHLDQLERGVCDLFGVGHHQRQRIADIAGRILAAGKDRPVVFDQTVARIAGHVGVGQHGMDAGRRLGRARCRC